MNTIWKLYGCIAICITILMLIKWLIMVTVSKVSDTYTVYKTVYYIQVVM